MERFFHTRKEVKDTQNVTSTVTINTVALNSLEQAAKNALVLTAEALHTEIVQAQVIPRDTGRLQNDATFVDDSNIQNGEVFISSLTPYARRLYFHPEYNFHREDWEDKHHKKHGSNPNAQGEWLEPWISGDKKEFVPKKYKAIYKRLIRGQGKA